MRIPKLKPGSAEFADESHPEKPRPRHRCCEAMNCAERGEHRAPKSRSSLTEYYWFCLDHVRDYNTRWDFHKGATPADIERDRYNAILGDRPTWRSTQAGSTVHDDIRKRMYFGFKTKGFSAFEDFATEDKTKDKNRFKPKGPTPEMEALATFGLEYPTNWREIKARYRDLVKKHHPDVNDSSADAVETVKKINIAYSILKLAHKKFSTFDTQEKTS